MENEDVYGGFYDYYTDDTFGEPVFETLADIWVRNELQPQDFDKVLELNDLTGYGAFDVFFDRLVCSENAPLLMGFNEELRDLLTGSQYLNFLINTGQTGEARDLLVNKKLSL